MYLIEEGIWRLRDVNARFINLENHKPLRSIYVMKNSEAWDRFEIHGTIWRTTG
jgi:predicted RNA-binding protein YlxR (DUF448 family)